MSIKKTERSLLFFSCCNRIISNYKSTLKVDYPTPTVLSSITVWDHTGVLLPKSRAIDAISVSIGSSESMTGCISVEGPPPINGTPHDGYTQRSLLCGEAGTQLALSFGAYIDLAPSPKPSCEFPKHN
jgi:hypothetical protein